MIPDKESWCDSVIPIVILEANDVIRNQLRTPRVGLNIDRRINDIIIAYLCYFKLISTRTRIIISFRLFIIFKIFNFYFIVKYRHSSAFCPGSYNAFEIKRTPVALIKINLIVLVSSLNACKGFFTEL